MARFRRFVEPFAGGGVKGHWPGAIGWASAEIPIRPTTDPHRCGQGRLQAQGVRMTDDKPEPTPVRVDQRRQKALGQVLERQFRELTEEATPDEFTRLLEAADRARALRAAGGGN